MSDNNKKNSKNNGLVLIKFPEKENKFIELNEEENLLKEKLLEIEYKLNSIDNIIFAVKEENSDTMFDSEVFNTIIGSIAISAAISVVAEYFNIKSEDINI